MFMVQQNFPRQIFPVYSIIHTCMKISYVYIVTYCVLGHTSLRTFCMTTNKLKFEGCIFVLLECRQYYCYKI